MSFVKIRSWVAGLCVLALVSCGGGGSSGDPLLGGGTSGTSTASKIDVTTSSATLGDGESTITVTAIVKDANNVGLANTALTWAASAGSLTGAALTTDSDGKAVATFSASDRSAVTATISASSGSAKGSAVVALQSTRTVAVSASAPAVGTDGGTVLITATVKDPNNATIAGAVVTWTADVGSLTNQKSVTNADGVATALYSPGATRTQPDATITVTSGLAPNQSSGSAVVQITATTTSVELLAASPTIGTGGDQVVISAFVKDANNIAKVGAPVSWSVDKGRISNQTVVTDVNGVARATLDAGSDKSNRTAVVRAVSGAASQTLNVPVVNTKLTYSGPTTTTVGSTVQLTFTAADSKQVVIPGVALTLTSSLGNGLTATATTDSAGQAILQYTANTPGSDTITVSGAGASVTVAMTVTGSDEDLAFVSPAAATKVVVGQSQTLTVRYRKSGVAQPNVVVNLAATIGKLSSGSVTTDASGQASVTVQSSFAGSSMLSATLAGSPVQATLPISFIATTPKSLVLQVTPTALAPNLAGSTSQQATVVAKVTDANSNPVAGSTVNFSQQADPSGGLLQQASAVTDLNGVATVQYLSGAESTASGAVLLKGTVASDATVYGTAAMTVNQSALFIALGTGNTITNSDPETYEKNWTVYVTDANGVRVTNVPVTIKVIPNYFAKGYMVWSESASQWVYAARLECPNEDGPNNPGRVSSTDTSPIWSTLTPPPAPLVLKPAEYNANGKLDPGEDLNGDGNLTPGNVVRLNASTVTTDSNGAATITMRYAELYAPWIGVRLTATAIVSGTESTSFKDFPLDKLAGDFSVKTVAPAGALSPFGVDVNSCTDTK
jgi:hypothetical protein